MAVEYECCSVIFFLHILIIILLVLFAGLMSGLTLSLMSLNLIDLEVLTKSDTTQDRKHAAKILSVVQKQHVLLCTLLICNAAAMEALPIFLDSLVTAWGAILISVTLILLFGEATKGITLPLGSDKLYSVSQNEMVRVLRAKMRWRRSMPPPALPLEDRIEEKCYFCSLFIQIDSDNFVTKWMHSCSASWNAWCLDCY